MNWTAVLDWNVTDTFEWESSIIEFRFSISSQVQKNPTKSNKWKMGAIVAIPLSLKALEIFQILIRFCEKRKIELKYMNCVEKINSQFGT